ncbi:MAG: alpha-glucosidase/alpha-galactosidase [Phycisphaerae bacterium]|nr:alpha-glucosidase/alpha-galactosidase [Phycisphaerae bacterium]
MGIKVAFIGAGSVGFTRRLMRDILAVPELSDTQFAFTDISKRNLDMVTRLCRKDIRNNDLPADIQATTDRRRALDGADYVVNCTRIGGLEAFRGDIDIPLKYGVDQCVGDTLCAGGILYGQRNVPCILEFCKDIREVAGDDALLLNYANPNAINTWAANTYGGVPTIGLCHGVQGGHKQLADVIELLVNEGRDADDPNYVRVTPDDVDIICAGINHQTWYVQVLYDGQDWTDRLLEGFEKHPTFRKTEKVRIDVLRRFGYYSTESNGHLSEYLPWYRKRPKETRQWISLDNWINGETGGYLRVCTEGRNWFQTDFPKWMAADDPPIGPGDRSNEHGSHIIEGLETGRVYRGHFNVPNDGCITNLPDDSIVEVPGYVDHNGVSIPQVGDLPLACAATLSASINVQRMAVEAAVAGDAILLKQAVLHDPLTAAVCTPEEVWQMVDEMLVAQAKWLPQYADEIPAAKKRLAAAKRGKRYKGTWTWDGSARLKVRSVQELRDAGDKARGVLDADKAAAQRAADAESGKTKRTRRRKSSRKKAAKKSRTGRGKSAKKSSGAKRAKKSHSSRKKS